ncbi:hypothetical protein FIE12Z_5236 [Fusarium flagelliforme]|uniref:Uncharacterized protein n=1 Tax=Fusarium flagelliforme TaxID=2675880 RepID=A0A395MSS8_9HYPO|nr:hypothetical protein FIE12Z_5236 [Fusarium flagelliforme]
MAEEEANRGPPPSPNFNPVDRETRKRFIKERFEHARQWNILQWEFFHKTAEYELCVKLHNADFEWVGAAFFDYLVDFASWAGYIEDRKLDHDQFCWPWARDMQPKLEDESGGRSQTFKAWLEAGGISAPTS